MAIKSIERVKAAVDFKTPDSVPVIAQVFGHAATLAGVALEDYVQDGDLLAGVMTTHLTEIERDSLLIDFGTNSEIALWDGQVLRRICVGGTFGRFLNVENAQRVGLLPMIQPELVELCGNIALAGCEDILLSPDAAESLKHLG